jgi:hypothetical protein
MINPRLGAFPSEVNNEAVPADDKDRYSVG